MRLDFRAIFLGLALSSAAGAAVAQTAPPSPAPAAAPEKPTVNKPKRHKFDPYQSPLATIMQFRLHADVPEAQDFVKETRPDKKTLKYTPLQSQLGPDPVRPTPRDAAGIDDLKAEMEAAIAHNEARVGGGAKGKAKIHRAKAAATTN